MISQKREVNLNSWGSNYLFEQNSFFIGIAYLESVSETRNKNVGSCDDRNRDEISKFLYSTWSFLC